MPVAIAPIVATKENSMKGSEPGPRQSRIVIAAAQTGIQSPSSRK